MRKTDRILRLREQINRELSSLNQREQILRNRNNRLNVISLTIDEPHALIPRSYATVDDWLKGHRFPQFVISNVYKNSTIAFQVSLSCYTYQYDYHIVRCESREYYEQKYLSKKEK